MKKFFYFWVLPLSFFWFWYFAARADLGAIFFSREVFDRTFHIYGQILGLGHDEIAWLIAKALVVDSLIILAIVAFRRRAKIAAFVRTMRSRGSGEQRFDRRLASVAGEPLASGPREVGKPV